MDIVTQEDTEVKIDALMREPCPHCGIRGYVSVGGVGNRATATCGLCDYSWDPTTEQDYIFGDPLPPDGCACVLPEQHCVICEEAARELYGGEELLF